MNTMLNGWIIAGAGWFVTVGFIYLLPSIIKVIAKVSWPGILLYGAVIWSGALCVFLVRVLWHKICARERSRQYRQLPLEQMLLFRRSDLNKSPKHHPPPPPVCALLRIRWFYSKENREHVELVAADLKKDSRDMRKEGRGKMFITAVLLWKIAGTVLPIFWDGVLRFVDRVFPVVRLVKRMFNL